MNSFRQLLLPAALAALLAGCQSGSSSAFDKSDGRVTVTFHEAEKFTDARDRSFGDTAQQHLTELERFLQDEVRRHLPAGHKLTLTFTDVDLAGDFEPWRGVRLNDVRMVRSIYPPRFVFSYVHTGADGQVVAQGDERLTNLAFQMQPGPFGGSDPLHYEKELLRDWIRDTLPK